MKTTPQRGRDGLVKWFRGMCREAGLRATPQRLEILQAIARCTGHPTAEDVHKGLRPRMPTLSLDTVYRALALFEQHGLLARVWGPDGRSRFDPNPVPHHHLTCQQCGRIEDLTCPAFDALQPPPAARKWGRVSHVQVQIRGLCNQCLARKGRKGGRRAHADATKSPRAQRRARGLS